MLLLLCLLSWAVAPSLLRGQIEQHASAALGRAVTVGRVEFRPWSLELSVFDLAVAKAGHGVQQPVAAEAGDMAASAQPPGQEPAGDAALAQASIARLYINASVQSLWRLAPVIDAIEIDEPVLHVTQHQAGQWDIDDVLARLNQPKKPSEPVRFALYNMVLHAGRVQLHDQVRQQDHVLQSLELALPFASNLPSQREVKIQPHLSFDLNGSQFVSSAQSTPFLDHRQTAIELDWKSIDLQPYLAYWPQELAVRPVAGVLDAALQIRFAQQPEAVVSIAGELALSQARLQDAAGAPLLEFERLTAKLDNVQPLQQQVQLSSVHWQGAHIYAHRDAKGAVNWLGLQPQAAGASPEKLAVAAEAPAAPAAAPWKLALDSFEMDQASVHWRDDAAAVGGRSSELQLQQLQLKARNIQWPMTQALDFSVDARLQQAQGGQAGAVATGTAEPALLSAQGRLDMQQGQAAVVLSQLPLQWFSAYAAAHFKPQVSGMAQAQLGLGWNGPSLVVQVADLTLDQLRVHDSKAPAQLARLQMQGAQLNLAQQSVQVERLALHEPRLAVERNAQGHWMYEAWLPAAGTAAPASARGAQTRPWALRLMALEVDGGAVQWRDAAPQTEQGATRPVALDLTALRVRLGAIEPLAAKAAPSSLELSARVGSGRRVQAGMLRFNGQLGLAPLQARGQLLAQAIPLHALEPYAADKLNVELARADGHFKGKLEFIQLAQGPQLGLQGDVQLTDLRMLSALAAPVAEESAPAASAASASGPQPAAVRTPAGAVAAVLTASTAERARVRGLGDRQELLAWKTLAVRGLDLQMRPGQALQLRVHDTALSDFYARVIVQANGRINLQDIVKTAKSEQSLQQTEQARPAAAQAVDQSAEPSVAAVDQPVQDTGPDTALRPVVEMGPVVLSGGKVQFSDYFIRPNYSADLSELAGRLSAFSSLPPPDQAQPEMAELALTGRAQGTASLEISGQLNPLAQPLALDVRAQMRDLELPPLSPYSIKYAGHGIERGKLQMDVRYRVQPDGQLTASNKLVLHQLQFGEAVPGAPASLPVRLAVALLADRHGVIDLDLPLSGSLNDPQFRLAPIIFKIIGNLIMKAVTSPFALLASALGGGDDADVVAFAPGSAQLDAKTAEGLDRITKALTDRPGLKLTVVGESQASVDLQAWKQVQLEQLLLAQKRRQALRDGKSADAVTSLQAGEVPGLTKALYSRTDMRKPRNLVGMAKEVPVSEMQALLLAQIPVPDDAMRELALARGVAVRDYLSRQNLPLERLFLGAPRADVSEPQWSPRAQLSLTMQ